MMKNCYESPMVDLFRVCAEDILTSSSGDNDAPFVPPSSGGSSGGAQDDGWSGYH